MHVILWSFLLLPLRIGAAEKSMTLLISHDKQRADLQQYVTESLNEWKDQIDIQFVTANDEVCDFFETHGVTAYVDMTALHWEQPLSDMFTKFGVPAISIDHTFSPMIEILGHFMQAREAADMAIIFERDYDLEVALYSLVRIQNGIRVVVYDKLDADTAKQIKMLRPAPAFYVIFATTTGMLDIFNKAVNFDLISAAIKWNLVFLDFQYAAFDVTHQQYSNISKLVMEQEQCCKFLAPTTNCRCPDDFSLEKTVISSALRYVAEMVTKNSLPSIKGDCKTSSNGNTQVPPPLLEMYNRLQQETPLVYSEDGQKLVSNLTMSVYASRDNRSTAIDRIAQVDRTGVQSGATIQEPGKRFFYVGAVEVVPWSWIVRNAITNEILRDANGHPIWDGYCIDFLKNLAEGMNFDYEIVLPANGGFGKRVGDKKWDGAIGDLYAGNTDIIVAPLKMTAEREEIIDFVAPYFEQTGILIVMRIPVRENSLFKFMTVLRLEVWLSIVAALIATAVTLWLLDKYSPYSARNNKEAYSYPCREFTLKESFWFALTSFTPQGGGEAPKAISGRTLVAAYWLFVVLMLATFTANLAAFLTVERMQTPVQSLEQLSRQSRINYTVVQESDTHQYFINMKYAEDTLYQVWKEITLNSTNDQWKFRVWDYPIREQWGHILLAIDSAQPVKNTREGFTKVNAALNADFAFIHDAAEIKYEISRNCNLTEVGEIMAEQPYAVAVQQGSHLQDEISRQILELQKDRFFELLKAKYWNSSVKGECPNSEDNEGITLESLGGVFIATLFGLTLAMVTLVFEVIYHKRKEMKVGKPEKVKNKILNVLPVEDDQKVNKVVTIGDSFVPADKKYQMSYISVFPRNSIHQHIQ